VVPAAGGLRARYRENLSEEQRVGAEWERHSALQYFRRYAFAVEVGNRRKKTGQGKAKGKRGRELWKGGNGYDAREEDEFKAEVKAEAKQSRALVTNGQHEQSSVIQAEQSRAEQGKPKTTINKGPKRARKRFYLTGT
jgi:hypothetical protein